jgi:hypothetical protein
MAVQAVMVAQALRQWVVLETMVELVYLFHLR